MDLQVEIKSGIMIVRPAGEMDLAVADVMRSALEKGLDQNPGIKDIIVNLSQVTYIDSSGLGVLLGRYKRVSRSGGRMFIVGAPPQVRRIIEMSGLLNIMKEFSSEAEALSHAG